ncbi:MAG: KEOPS complex subunit Pcc1 [archaeon]|nr:KEOPS complex subunit Pcc1 [archaeon]
MIFMELETQFEFPDEGTANAVCRAVSVELNTEFQKRSKTTINTNKNVVLLKISAEDESALKASEFTFTRLLELCKEVSEVKTNE